MRSRRGLRVAAILTGAVGIMSAARAEPVDGNGEPRAAAALPIVVTASNADRTAVRSAMSVSQVGQERLRQFAPRSLAESLRPIAGLNLQDTAGPGGNSNIGVRGIPVSTGGSEYVALQEDGHPVVLFGDIMFGNNDYWLRLDNSVDRIEAVRGGTSPTFASQAPGAVVNFVSRDGSVPERTAVLSTGLDFREHRLDFAVGGSLSGGWRAHVGGFAVTGGGPTHLPWEARRGYQIKANVTRDLAGGDGFVRINFKRLDDRAPTFTSMPSRVTIDGNRVSGYAPFGGVDARSYASASAYTRTFPILNADGSIAVVPLNGIHADVTSVGGEISYPLTPWLRLGNKLRWSRIAGSFANQWTGEIAADTVVGKTIADAFGTFADERVIGDVRYAAGPRAGERYEGRFLSNSAQAFTRIRSLDSLANDFAARASVPLAAGATLEATAGWFHMRQEIAMDWRINNMTQSLEGSGGAVPLDLFAADGTPLSVYGRTGFNNQWGGCCGGRSYGLAYTDDAFYGEAKVTTGRLTIDASIRRDRMGAKGTAFAPERIAGGITVPTPSGPVTLPAQNTGSAPVNRLDYGLSYDNWSAGALFAVRPDTSVFIRASRGGRFNADRLLYNNDNFTPTGALTEKGRYLSVNWVTQQEMGLSHASTRGAASYRLRAVYYRAQVKESNYDFTAPSRGESPFVDKCYRSEGFELSGGVRKGRAMLDGYVVYTAARDARAGTRPVAMPLWTWLAAAAVETGPVTWGLSATGQSDFAISGGYIASGSTFANAFARIRVSERIEIGAHVNNLLDTLGYRANNGSLQARGQGGLGPNEALLDNSAMLGRTSTAWVRVSF